MNPSGIKNNLREDFIDARESFLYGWFGHARTTGCLPHASYSCPPALMWRAARAVVIARRCAGDLKESVCPRMEEWAFDR
jgi:hypothetical protein